MYAQSDLITCLYKLDRLHLWHRESIEVYLVHVYDGSCRIYFKLVGIISLTCDLLGISLKANSTVYSNQVKANRWLVIDSNLLRTLLSL